MITVDQPKLIPQVQPLVLRSINIDSTYFNAELLNAADYLFKPILTERVFSSGLCNVDYMDILAEIFTTKYKGHKLDILENGSSIGKEKKITIFNKTINGNSVLINLYSKGESHIGTDNETEQTIFSFTLGVPINKFTSLIINEIEPNSKVYLYMEEINKNK